VESLYRMLVSAYIESDGVNSIMALDMKFVWQTPCVFREELWRPGKCFEASSAIQTNSGPYQQLVRKSLHAKIRILRHMGDVGGEENGCRELGPDDIGRVWSEASRNSTHLEDSRTGD
jgi:hypothetical protein